MAIKKTEPTKKTMAKKPGIPVSSRMKTLPTVKPYREDPIDRGQLEEVIVREKRLPKKPSVMPKASVSSAIKTLPTLKAPAPAPGKKMGRLKTALSDATSMYRGAANMAFGKNQSQTTGGKILERVARVGAAALGVGVQPAAAASSYGSQMAKATNKATGYVRKGTKAAVRAGTKSLGTAIGLGTTLAPAVLGQIGFNKRTEADKKRGMFNPGRGNANLGNINFDKPFQKKKKK